MAKVLAFDLGETTGYCLLEGEKAWKIAKHGIFSRVSAVMVVVPLLRENSDLVVLERQAHGEFGKRSEEELSLQRLLYTLFPQIHSIRAVDWKSGPWKNLSARAAYGQTVSKHEQDAYRIAMYATERILPYVTDS